MKAISGIFLAVLVVLIAISLALLAYIFFYKTFATTAGAEEVPINTTLSKMSTGLEIEAAAGKTIYLRNTGTSELKNFLVYVNGNPVSFDINPSVLPPQGVATITLTDCTPQSDVDINVVGPGVKAYHLAHNMAFCGGCDFHIQSLPDTYLINQSNKLYCLDNNVYISGKTAINFSSGIQNSTLNCQGYNIDGNNAVDTSGVYLTGIGTINNTIKNCNVTRYNSGIYLYNGPNSNSIINNTASNNYKYGIWLNTSSNNNILTNNIVSNNNDDGIALFSSSNNQLTNNILNNNIGDGITISTSSNNNILTNNIVSNDMEEGIGVYSSSNNIITGGSVTLSSLADYYLQSAGTTNNFTSTNFTSARKIWFYESTSWFNYNNDTGSTWLKTNVSTPSNITRKLVNWDQTLIKWNDTSNTAVTATYNITGLTSNTGYNVYNNSVLVYTLNSGSIGQISFTINLPANQQHEIRVEKYIGLCQFFINFLPYNITQNNTYYCLGNSFTNLVATAIQFGNSSNWAIQNSTLDCQGYNIDGNDASNIYGVYLAGTSTKNNIIKNCTITDFFNGIYLQNGPSSNNLTNINSSSNINFGIWLTNSSNNILTSITANSNNFSIVLGWGTNTYSNNNILTIITTRSSTCGIDLYDSSNNTLTNVDATSNGYNGMFLESSSNNNTLTNIDVSSSNGYGIDLFDSRNNTLTSITSNSNDDVGFRLNNFSNSTFNNINASKNVIGMSLNMSSNNVISNNNASNNTLYGFFFYGSSNNMVANSTMTGNGQWPVTDASDDKAGDGANISFGSTNNIFTNCKTSGNADAGFFTHASSNQNSFINDTSINEGDGFDINSDSNIITNCTAINSSDAGVEIEGNNNIISNSVISGSGKEGIVFTSVSGNLLYNNLFNSSKNVYYVAVLNNFFNTTNQTGTRIYGAGNRIGGNYWTNSSGTGYSDTCQDSNGDRFCDVPYMLATNNIDYLPLRK